MKSYDLINWEIVNYTCDIIDDSDAFALRNGASAYGRGTWAASIRYHSGTFYVTVASFTTNKTYIFQTEDIDNGTWHKSVIDQMYHDQSLLFDDDGKVYLISGVGKIHIVELTADATAVKPGGLDRVLLEKSETEVGGTGGLPAEGAHFYKIGGRYYIFFIAWPPTGSGRRLQICYRADSLLGPYEGRVLLDDDIGFKNNGVAQGGVVDTPDGDWYALLFQDHGAVGRIPVLVPMVWEDGWPVLGVDSRVPEEMDLPNLSGNNCSVVCSDEFDGSSLPLQWQWNHNPDNELWSLSDRPGYLRLKSGFLYNDLLSAKNTLTQRSYGPVCSGKVAIDVSNMKDGDVAGLAALQDVHGYVCVKMIDGKKFVMMCSAESGEQAKDKKVIPFNGDVVYLRLDFDYRDAIDKVYFYYSENEVNWYSIGEVLDMKYLLTHFTGYRFALFYFSTQNTGGFVDFDYFRIA